MHPEASSGRCLISSVSPLSKKDRATPEGSWIIDDGDCIHRLNQTLLKAFWGGILRPP